MILILIKSQKLVSFLFLSNIKYNLLIKLYKIYNFINKSIKAYIFFNTQIKNYILFYFFFYLKYGLTKPFVL